MAFSYSSACARSRHSPPSPCSSSPAAAMPKPGSASRRWAWLPCSPSPWTPRCCLAPSAMPATVRILIVEDDPQDAELAQRQIRRADLFCAFLRVDTRDAMVAALREFTPDVILTDHSLPTFSARDALQLAQQLSPGTP